MNTKVALSALAAAMLLTACAKNDSSGTEPAASEPEQCSGVDAALGQFRRDGQPEQWRSARRGSVRQRYSSGQPAAGEPAAGQRQPAAAVSHLCSGELAAASRHWYDTARMDRAGELSGPCFFGIPGMPI